MSEDSATAGANLLSSLLNPSERMSGWLFMLGSWGLMLGLLNIMQLATPTGDKVVWSSILSLGLVGGEYINDNPDYRLYSDTAFLMLCAVGTGLGLRGILSSVDGGIIGWLYSVRDAFWPSLIDPDSDGGWNSTLSAWLLLIGICFYFYMGILHTGWVDPGVYSVSAPFVAFGMALKLLATALTEEESQSTD